MVRKTSPARQAFIYTQTVSDADDADDATELNNSYDDELPNISYDDGTRGKQKPKEENEQEHHSGNHVIEESLGLFYGSDGEDDDGEDGEDDDSFYATDREDDDSPEQPSGSPSKLKEHLLESIGLGSPVLQPPDLSNHPADCPSPKTLSDNSQTFIPQTVASLGAWDQHTPFQQSPFHPNPTVLSNLPAYPYQPYPFLDLATEDRDYEKAKSYTNNEDIEMDQADTEMEDLQDGPTSAYNSAPTFAFETPQACFPLQDILMEDTIQITGSNINSTATLAFEAPQVWNLPLLQDTSIANAIQSPEAAIEFQFLEQYGTYQCQAPIYVPWGHFNESFLIDIHNAVQPNCFTEGVHHFDLISNQFVPSIMIIYPVPWILPCIFDIWAGHWVSLQPIPTSLPAWHMTPIEPPVYGSNYDVESASTASSVEAPTSDIPQRNVEGEVEEATEHSVISSLASQPSYHCERHERQHTAGASASLDEKKDESQPSSEKSESIQSANGKNKRTRDESISHDPNTRPAKCHRTNANVPPSLLPPSPSLSPPRNYFHILDSSTRPKEDATIPARPTNKRTRDEFEGLATKELEIITKEGPEEGTGPLRPKKRVRFVEPSYGRGKGLRKKQKVDRELVQDCTMRAFHIMVKDLESRFRRERKRREAAASATAAAVAAFAATADRRAEVPRTAPRSNIWSWTWIKPIAGIFGWV